MQLDIVRPLEGGAAAGACHLSGGAAPTLPFIRSEKKPGVNEAALPSIWARAVAAP